MNIPQAQVDADRQEIMSICARYLLSYSPRLQRLVAQEKRIAKRDAKRRRKTKHRAA